MTQHLHPSAIVLHIAIVVLFLTTTQSTPTSAILTNKLTGSIAPLAPPVLIRQSTPSPSPSVSVSPSPTTSQTPESSSTPSPTENEKASGKEDDEKKKGGGGNKALAAIAVVALLAAVGGAFWWWRKRRNGTSPADVPVYQRTDDENVWA